MLDAGREIISEGTYEDLSVEAVCQLAGTTVGTFYGRFENKEKFFVTLQRLQSFRSQALLAQVIDRHSKGKPNLDRLVQDMVELMVGHFRSNFGIMRASLQHTKEGMWQVLKASGDLPPGRVRRRDGAPAAAAGGTGATPRPVRLPGARGRAGPLRS